MQATVLSTESESIWFTVPRGHLLEMNGTQHMLFCLPDVGRAALGPELLLSPTLLSMLSHTVEEVLLPEGCHREMQPMFSCCLCL